MLFYIIQISIYLIYSNYIKEYARISYAFTPYINIFDSELCERSDSGAV